VPAPVARERGSISHHFTEKTLRGAPSPPSEMVQPQHYFVCPANRRAPRWAKKIFKNFFTRIFTGVSPGFAAAAAARLKFSSSLFFILATVRRNACDRRRVLRGKSCRARPKRFGRHQGSGHHEAGIRDTRHLRRETVTIARQQKGHDGFALLRKCWPPTLGDVGGQLFFTRRPAPLERRGRDALSLRGSFGLSCIIFKSEWPPSSESGIFRQRGKTQGEVSGSPGQGNFT